MKSIEKRIRHLELLHPPRDQGPTCLWTEFELRIALSRNIPKFWPDPDAMPKFLQEACHQSEVRFASSQESLND